AVVEIPLDASTRERVFAEGTGFYAHPALSPDGSRLAWVQWGEDQMPWDRASLIVSDLADGGQTLVTAGTALQPEWHDDATLLYLDDPTGRWNLYRAVFDGDGLRTEPTAVSPADADT